MTRTRWERLMDDDEAQLTERELADGWHWCAEFDGLLVGPGMGELEVCRCGEEQERARQSMVHQEAMKRMETEKRKHTVF